MEMELVNDRLLIRLYEGVLVVFEGEALKELQERLHRKQTKEQTKAKPLWMVFSEER